MPKLLDALQHPLRPLPYEMGILSVGLCLLSFAIPLVGHSESMEFPRCTFQSEYIPEHAVSLSVSKVGTRPGSPCVRIANTTARAIAHGGGDLRLERRWVGLIWSSVLRLQDFVSGERILFTLVLHLVNPGDTIDLYPALHVPLSPGTYRVRLRYEVRPEPEKEEPTIHMLPEEEEPKGHESSEREEYTIYSEVFVLP